MARVKLNFSLGIFIRGEITRKIRRFLDGINDLTYDLKEYKSLFDSDYLLIINGPDNLAIAAGEAITNYFKNIDESRA